MTIRLNYNGETLGSTIERLVYTAFNVDIYIKENQIVAHKNKIGTDNRLSNLMVMTYSDSHRLNFKKGLLPHLKKNNDLKHINFEKQYIQIKTKTCNQCGKTKAVEMFEKKRYTCRKCRNEKQLEWYHKQKGLNKPLAQ